MALSQGKRKTNDGYTSDLLMDSVSKKVAATDLTHYLHNSFNPYSIGQDLLMDLQIEMFELLGCLDGLSIDLSIFQLFLHEIRKNYLPNQYHNWIHACHVAINSFRYLYPIREQFLIEETFGCILAALIHDVGHTGLSNAHMKSIDHPYAKEFENSYLERNSLRLFSNIIEKKEFNFLEHLPVDKQNSITNVIHSSILLTDIGFGERMKMYKDDMKSTLDTACAGVEKDPEDDEASLELKIMEQFDTPESRLLLLKLILLAADVGIVFEKWSVYCDGVRRLYQEIVGFNDALEVSNFIASQSAFLGSYARNIAETSQRLKWKHMDTYIENFNSNISRWSKIQESETLQSLVLNETPPTEEEWQAVT